MKKKYSGVCVKNYFNKQDFAEVAQDAEKAGIRRVGLQLYTQKPHGLANEKLANTDSVAKFLKFCWKYWVNDKASRLTKFREIAIKEEQLKKERELLGVK